MAVGYIHWKSENASDGLIHDVRRLYISGGILYAGKAERSIYLTLAANNPNIELLKSRRVQLISMDILRA